ncbi:MAG: acyltransferase [Betaproteobacteria bacterium]
MRKEFSIYLDLIRFLAACLVVVYHSNLRAVVEPVLPASNYGHPAVIVFFVLSGYVIAFITDRKENTPVEYWASRLSRIYSLAIPAILLSVILDNVGERIEPSFYQGATTHDYGLLRAATSWLFINEIWTISITAFSNVPYWSLCYEMWYYVMFSVLTFMKGGRRVAVLVLIALFLGPKILLLAPLWFLGVVLYRWKAPERMPEWLGWVCTLGSIVAIVLFEHFDLTDVLTDTLKAAIGAQALKELTFSKFFLGDYLLGPIVYVNFLGMRRIAHRFSWLLLGAQRPIKACAGYTFSAYIYHQPLILFWAAVINGSPSGYAFYAGVISATVASIWILGWLTEQRRFWLREQLRTELPKLARLPILRRLGAS